MNKLTTTFKSWGLVQLQPTILFFKNTYTVIQYFLIWVERIIDGGLSYLAIYCFYALTSIIVIPIIFFVLIRKVKTKIHALKSITLHVKALTKKTNSH